MPIAALVLHWLYLAVDLAGLAAITLILWRLGHKTWVVAAPTLATTALATAFETWSAVAAHIPPFAFGLYNVLQPPLSLVVPLFIVVIAFSSPLPSRRS